MDWTERWLHALAAFQLCVWLLAVFTRKYNNVQMVLLVLVRASKRRLAPRASTCHTSLRPYMTCKLVMMMMIVPPRRLAARRGVPWFFAYAQCLA